MLVFEINEPSLMHTLHMRHDWYQIKFWYLNLYQKIFVASICMNARHSFTSLCSDIVARLPPQSNKLPFELYKGNCLCMFECGLCVCVCILHCGIWFVYTLYICVCVFVSVCVCVIQFGYISLLFQSRWVGLGSLSIFAFAFVSLHFSANYTAHIYCMVKLFYWATLYVAYLTLSLSSSVPLLACIFFRIHWLRNLFLWFWNSIAISLIYQAQNSDTIHPYKLHT